MDIQIENGIALIVIIFFVLIIGFYIILNLYKEAIFISNSDKQHTKPLENCNYPI